MSSPHTTPTSPISPRGTVEPDPVRFRLLAYRVMAYVTGVFLLVLCAEIVLHYGFDNMALSWAAPVHGFLYIVYLVTVLLLGTALHWGLSRLLLVALAGTIPLMSFVAEHAVRRQVQAEQAGTAPADPAAAAAPEPSE